MAKKIDHNRLFHALEKNLIPTFTQSVSKEFLQGKLETFLTCRALAAYLQEKVLNETTGKFFEEASLNAIYKTLTSTAIPLPEVCLLSNELPNLLQLKYPAVKELIQSCEKILSNAKNVCRINNMWKNFVEFDYLLKMLKAI